jgi:hypothetical protein
MNYLKMLLCGNRVTKIVEYGLLFDPSKPSKQLVDKLTSTKELETLKDYLRIDMDEPQTLRLLGLVSMLLLNKQGFELFVE